MQTEELPSVLPKRDTRLQGLAIIYCVAVHAGGTAAEISVLLGCPCML
jgi:hypothetical protein